jgi:hypothetical protein
VCRSNFLTKASPISRVSPSSCVLRCLAEQSRTGSIIGLACSILHDWTQAILLSSVWLTASNVTERSVVDSVGLDENNTSKTQRGIEPTQPTRPTSRQTSDTVLVQMQWVLTAFALRAQFLPLFSIRTFVLGCCLG